MPIKDMLKEGDPFKNVARHGPEDISEWKRVPGLFRSFEFSQIIDDDDAISFQQHGKDEHGIQLWALYRHRPLVTL